MSLFFNEKRTSIQILKALNMQKREQILSMFVKCHFVPSTACGANLAKFGHLRFGHQQLFCKNTACLELNRGYKMPVYSWSRIILPLVYYQSFPNLYSNPFYIKNQAFYSPWSKCGARCILNRMEEVHYDFGFCALDL